MNNNTVQIPSKKYNGKSVGKKIKRINIIRQPEQIYKIVDSNFEYLILTSIPII